MLPPHLASNMHFNYGSNLGNMYDEEGDLESASSSPLQYYTESQFRTLSPAQRELIRNSHRRSFIRSPPAIMMLLTFLAVAAVALYQMNHDITEVMLMWATFVPVSRFSMPIPYLATPNPYEDVLTDLCAQMAAMLLLLGCLIAHHKLPKDMSYCGRSAIHHFTGTTYVAACILAYMLQQKDPDDKGNFVLAIGMSWFFALPVSLFLLRQWRKHVGGVERSY